VWRTPRWGELLRDTNLGVGVPALFESARIHQGQVAPPGVHHVRHDQVSPQIVVVDERRGEALRDAVAGFGGHFHAQIKPGVGSVKAGACHREHKDRGIEMY